MKKKIVGIFVCMLLITTAIPALGTNIVIQESTYIILESPEGTDDVKSTPFFWWLLGADQKQTEDNKYGYQVRTPFILAQEFKPTKDKLTAVALQMFKFNDPPVELEIKVSIRETLNGTDLTSTSINADNIKGKKWYLFDFEDISVTPETIYYIVCSEGGGDIDNSYAWLFGLNNTYDRGIAYESQDDGTNWVDLEQVGEWSEIDFCFITYFKEPRNKPANTPSILLTENKISTYQSNPREPLPPTKWGLDQEQDTNCGVGMALLPNCTLAQSFKPTIDKLTAVQIHCFKYWNPPDGVKLTVSVRDSLNGSDLTEKTMDADSIMPHLDGGTWVTFDFPDINVTPENTYYILCDSDGGIYPNNYAWFFDVDDTYTRGEAWYKHVNESSWDTLHEYFIKYNETRFPDPDYCFKTYTKKSKDIGFIENTFFQRFFQKHTHMLPLLRQLLGL